MPRNRPVQMRGIRRIRRQTMTPAEIEAAIGESIPPSSSSPTFETDSEYNFRTGTGGRSFSESSSTPGSSPNTSSSRRALSPESIDSYLLSLDEEASQIYSGTTPGAPTSSPPGRGVAAGKEPIERGRFSTPGPTTRGPMIAGRPSNFRTTPNPLGGSSGTPHFSPSYYRGSSGSPRFSIPGLSSQQGTPSAQSGSGTMPSPITPISRGRGPTPPSFSPSPTYDRTSKKGYEAFGKWSADDEKVLRKRAIKQAFKEKYKAYQNLANPVTTEPSADQPPSLSTTPPSGLPASAVGEGQGGGAPPSAGEAGAASSAGGGPAAAEEGEVAMGAENRSSGMMGAHPYPAGNEGGFKIPTSRAPPGIGNAGGGNPLGGGGGGSSMTPAAAAQGGGGGGGDRPGETRRGEGEYMPPPYGDGSAFAEKSRESDSDRVDPITPAGGSKQTPETANSLVSANKIMKSAQKQPQEKVLGDAEERANMGKGAFSGYEFAGPYDYPTFPSGRKNTELTSLGAWRSKTGEHSASLWSSKLTARGQPAKREKFYKWSTKGGGNWGNLNSKDAMRVMTKNSARKNGSRWMAQPNPGDRLTDMMASTLKRKMGDIELGKMGNERKNKRMRGADPVGNFQVQK